MDPDPTLNYNQILNDILNNPRALSQFVDMVQQIVRELPVPQVIDFGYSHPAKEFEKSDRVRWNKEGF